MPAATHTHTCTDQFGASLPYIARLISSEGPSLAALTRFLDPTFAPAFKAIREAGKGDQFIDDLITSPGLKNAAESLTEGQVRAWEKLLDFTHLRKDVDILKSYSKILDNHAPFMQAYGEKVKNIIGKLGEAGAKCNSCPANTQNLIKPYMQSIDQHLDDLEYMISKHNNIPGFAGTNSLINEMASSSAKADGGAFIMQYIRKNPTEFQGLSKFEFKYDDDLLNRADVLVNTTKYEMKSWSHGGEAWNAFFKGNGNSYQQFISYLQNTTSLSDLKYVFNGAKASESQVKAAFNGLFSSKSSEIYLSNPTLFNKLDAIGGGKVNSLSKFQELINAPSFNVNNQLFSFIQI